MVPFAVLLAAMHASPGTGAPATGSAPPLSNGKAYQSCLDHSGGVTATMRACAAAEYRRLDRELDLTWRKTMARLGDTQAKDRLRTEQRTWLQMRKQECDRQVEGSGMYGGTGADLIADTCAIAQLEKRIAWLEAYR